ncbi:hypothetical protein Tco_0026755 [Tanacetum coccineum]
MGEPLSPDRVFDFPMDEPHPAYDFFAPGPLPGYVGNPNNMNRWIEADVPLLGEMGEPLGAERRDGRLVIDMEADLAMRLCDDGDSGDDDSKGPEGDEEVWEVNEEWLMAPVTPPPMPVMPPPSTYEVGGSSTAAAEGHSLTLLAPGVPVPPSVIKDLCTRMGLSQQVQTLQAAVQHRDVQIQQLQTLVAEMSSHEGTLMQCILGLDSRLADVERISPGPQ